MVKKPVKPPAKPEKRRPKEEDYFVINLATLTRFSVFVDEVQRSEGPVSFRFFMKNRGAHRTMAITVNALETLSKQLMLRRQILDEEGKPTNRYVSNYAALDKLNTRRENGVSRDRGITRHGYAWAEFGDLVHELFELMIDGGDHTEDLRSFIRHFRNDTRETLKRIKEKQSVSREA